MTLPIPGPHLLLPEHRAHLQTSGLSDETIAEASIMSVDEKQARMLGYAKGIRGIAIPYPDTRLVIDGRPVPYTRLRVDEDVRRKPGLKYENVLSKRIEEGLSHYPYVPPGVEAIRKDARQPVFITEGEKKALKMTQETWPTIGLPGVFMFTDPTSKREPGDKPLHPELRRWRWRGRIVLVCFDSDRLEKNSVALAHERLCAALTREGAVVRVVNVFNLPGLDKTGADDFLVRSGQEAFRVLVEQARGWEPFAHLVEMLPVGLTIPALFEALSDVRHKLLKANVEERRHVALRLMERYPTLEQAEAEGLLTRQGRPVEGPLPCIVVNDGQMRDVVKQSWTALLQSRFGPRLFRYGDALVLGPEQIDGAVLRLKVVDLGLLTWLLNRSADWLRMKKGGEIGDGRLTADVVKDVAAVPHSRVPRLDAIVRVPVITADGSVLGGSGYVAEAHILQIVDASVMGVVSSLPQKPSVEVRRRALAFVLEEVLGDFPLARLSDRAHALSLLLLPLVRHLVSGPTPLHLVEAPSEGTGKSLLADVVSVVATGRRSQPTPLPLREEELRKKLTAVLLGAPNLVLFDNVNHAIDSASLAAILASVRWNDRLLGQSKQLSMPNRAIWIATANNPCLSREIARRTVRIRLDAGVEQPWLRDEFRHADLIGWLKSERARVIAALLTLIRGWLANGRVEGTVRLGSFESWSSVVGGVLASAGVDGFLADRHEQHSVVDPEEGDWEALVTAWHEAYELNPQTARTLLEMATERQLLGLGGGNDTKARARFFQGLSRRRDRIYGPWRIDMSRDRKRKRNVYSLVPGA